MSSNYKSTVEKLTFLRNALLTEDYDQQDIYNCIVGIGNRCDFRSGIVYSETYVRYDDHRFDGMSEAVSAFTRKFGVTRDDAKMLFQGRFAHSKDGSYTVRQARKAVNKLIKVYTN